MYDDAWSEDRAKLDSDENMKTSSGHLSGWKPLSGTVKSGPTTDGWTNGRSNDREVHGFSFCFRGFLLSGKL